MGARQHLRVDKAPLGELFEYCRLTALKPSLGLPVTGAGFLAFVAASRRATISRALAPPDAFLLTKCQIRLQTYALEKRTLCSEPEAGFKFESDTRDTPERMIEDMASGRNNRDKPGTARLVSLVHDTYTYYVFYGTKNHC